jgi:hypothetical protein
VCLLVQGGALQKATRAAREKRLASYEVYLAVRSIFHNRRGLVSSAMCKLREILGREREDVAVRENSLPLLTSEGRGARAPNRGLKAESFNFGTSFVLTTFKKHRRCRTRIEGKCSEKTARRDYLRHDFSDFAL